MKLIKIIPTISVHFDEGVTKDGQAFSARDLDISMIEFVTKHILKDEKWGKNDEWLESADAIKIAFDKADKTGVAEIHQNDYTRLLEATKTPSSPYIPVIVRQLLPYIREIKNPTGQLPSEKAIPEASAPTTPQA